VVEAHADDDELVTDDDDDEDEDDNGDDIEDELNVSEDEETHEELESVGEIVLINSSAVIGANLTFGGDNGDNKSKS